MNTPQPGDFFVRQGGETLASAEEPGVVSHLAMAIFLSVKRAEAGPADLCMVENTEQAIAVARAVGEKVEVAREDLCPQGVVQAAAARAIEMISGDEALAERETAETEGVDRSRPSTIAELQSTARAEIDDLFDWLEDRPAAALKPSQLVTLAAPTDARSAPLFAVDGVDHDGNPTRYELVGYLDAPASDNFVCMAAGKPQRYQDSARLATGGETATAAGWFGWIAQEIADAHAADAITRSKWAGDDLDSAMTRMERGIVAYTDRATAVLAHHGVESLQAWIDDVFEGCPVRPIVHGIEHDRLAQESELVVLQACHLDPDEDPTRYWIKAALNVTGDGDDWFIQVGARVTPAIAAEYDGTNVTAYDSVATLDIDDLHRLRTDSTDEQDWYAIELPGVPTALAMPGACILEARTDRDGASVWLGVSPVEERAPELMRMAAYRVEWATWLDEDPVVDPATLNAEIEHAEQTLADLAEQDA